MAPLEPWERVWIDATTYPQDVHAYLNCTDCHGGESVTDMDLAHANMTADPSNDPETGCATCHPDVVPSASNSLHSTLAGYDTVLYQRSSPENFETIEHMQQNHCDSCHATCGDCHVSQPNSVGGGLLSGHVFVETPPMSRTCTACHGSRVKDEYFGAHEGIPSDVHFRERMACESCHTANEIHGTNSSDNHRYAGSQNPTCESCHKEQIGVGSGIEQHEVHGTELLSCQVCHSTTYTNCVNCHVEQTEDGIPFYTVEEHFLGFYIGKNPVQNSERPYRYVPVRHVPVDKESFDFYGNDLLSNFDSLPTWAYTTPHNIQRITPQTESCTACHGNTNVFLTPDKVAPEELNANQGVIVETPPVLPEGYTDTSTIEEETPAEDDSFWGSESSEESDTDDSFWGEDGSTDDTSPTNTESDDDFWGSE